MRTIQSGWLLCLVAAGCGASAQSAKRSEPAYLTLLLYNLGANGKGLTPVAPGGTLRSGERYAVRVEADRPAYLHLWQKSGAQAPVPLLTTPLPLEPRRALHLPEEGKEYALDQTSGLEQIFVLVAAAPLSEAQQRDELGKDPTRAARGGRGDPPPEMTEKGRGNPKAVRVPLRTAQPTLARFFFQHTS